MRGYLYVLTNPHMPGLVKIGCTDRTPRERADELSRATGVPGRFKVERSWVLDDAHAFEQRVHAGLAAYRVSGEHFQLSAAAAIERIETMLRAAGTTPHSSAWRSHLERITAAVLLIAACWAALRRLHRNLRRLRAALH
jgi:T5orf172 domain